jgi:hypothetical protein
MTTTVRTAREATEPSARAKSCILSHRLVGPGSGALQSFPPALMTGHAPPSDPQSLKDHPPCTPTHQTTAHSRRPRIPRCWRTPHHRQGNRNVDGVVMRSFDSVSQHNGPTGGSAPTAVLPAMAPREDVATALRPPRPFCQLWRLARTLRPPCAPYGRFASYGAWRELCNRPAPPTAVLPATAHGEDFGTALPPSSSPLTVRTDRHTLRP